VKSSLRLLVAALFAALFLLFAPRPAHAQAWQFTLANSHVPGAWDATNHSGDTMTASFLAYRWFRFHLVTASDTQDCDMPQTSSFTALITYMEPFYPFNILSERVACVVTPWTANNLTHTAPPQTMIVEGNCEVDVKAWETQEGSPPVQIPIPKSTIVCTGFMSGTRTFWDALDHRAVNDPAGYASECDSTMQVYGGILTQNGVSKGSVHYAARDPKHRIHFAVTLKSQDKKRAQEVSPVVLRANPTLTTAAGAKS
jgi:hypothetical protein